jgi:hypothetical protein
MQFLKNLNKLGNEFFFIIGEDGLVFTYFVQGIMKARGFFTNQDIEETKDLRKWLMGDPDAKISIFVDSIDQTYTQRSIPVVGLWGANSLAQNRLEKDHAKQQLKAAIPVGRLAKGRRDYFYIFAAASHEGVVGNWLRFLLPFPNIIKGIYLLPIELYSVIEAIRVSHAHNTLETNVDKTKKDIKPGNKVSGENPELSKWEIILVNNKSGGFRQVAYCNGAAIFTRLLSSSGTIDDDVIAGNIEQEIISSIEYLRRIAVTDISSIDLYLIIPDTIKEHLRTNRLGITSISIHNPHQLSLKLGNADPLTKNKDRFADPSILALFATRKKRIALMHVKETRQVMQVVNTLSAGIWTIYASIPLLGILSLWHLFGVVNGITNLSDIKKQLDSVNAKLVISKQEKSKSESKYGKDVNINMIKEKAYIFADIEGSLISPLFIVHKVAGISPAIVKIRGINWQYDAFREGSAGNQPNQQNRRLNRSEQRSSPQPLTSSPVNNNNNKSKLSYKYSGNFTVVFDNSSGNYAELVDKYADYSRRLAATLSDHSTEISSLPQNFSFSEEQTKIKLSVDINFPKIEDVKKRELKL